MHADNNQWVGISSVRGSATIGFVICLYSSEGDPSEHVMWVGSAPSADHVRRGGYVVGRRVAGAGVATGSRAFAAWVDPGRGRQGGWAAGGDGGGGLHGLAVRGRGDHRRWVRSTRRRARRYASGAWSEASGQDGSVRRPVVARVVATR